jgi:hypothetical protein
MDNLTFLDLHPGDILLCKGEGWISDLIVLFDEGPYSHAALYAGVINGEHSVIQATERGMLCCPIKSLEEEIFTDVFRFNKNNHQIGMEDYPYDPIYKVGNGYVAAGTKYAFSHLVMLAILAATRDIPLDPTTQKILRIVLDNAAAFIFKLRDEGKTPMVCSELVYRCFDEADASKKYQFAVSALKMTDVLQGTNDVLNNPVNTDALGIDLLNAKKNFIEAWNKAKQAVNDTGDFSNNPVAACVSPRDIKNSSDLTNIGRLSFK